MSGSHPACCRLPESALQRMDRRPLTWLKERQIRRTPFRGPDLTPINDAGALSADIRSMPNARALAERTVPRYTSYPTAPHFTAAVGAGTYADCRRFDLDHGRRRPKRLY